MLQGYYIVLGRIEVAQGGYNGPQYSMSGCAKDLSRVLDGKEEERRASEADGLRCECVHPTGIWEEKYYYVCTGPKQILTFA